MEKIFSRSHFMRTCSMIMCCLLVLHAGAQQQTYDLLSFTPPKGWKKNTQEDIITFTRTDANKTKWARIVIVKSTASKGNIHEDFENEWLELAVKPYKVDKQPLATDTQTFQGWKFYSGMSRFKSGKDTAAILLGTFSNGHRCTSFTILSNTTSYGSILDDFIASITLPPPGNSQKNESIPADLAAAGSEFHFNTTNFDDGWNSVVKEDWVEVTKGALKALLHHPRKEEAEYIPEQADRTRLFWNLLVAPRYSLMSDFYLYNYNMSSEPAYFASATMTDNAGKTQFVALFSKGGKGWIEILAPDKNTFIKNFGVNQPDQYYAQWDALTSLSGKNYFAVHENDLKGKWSSDFTGSMHYYSVYTGLYSGFNAYTSRQSFTFNNGKTYQWKLATANTTSGGTKAQVTESAGNFSSKGYWQLVFTNIQNKPKTYNVYFSCIKGGRILWLQDAEYGSYTAYGKSAK